MLLAVFSWLFFFCCCPETYNSYSLEKHSRPRKDQVSNFLLDLASKLATKGRQLRGVNEGSTNENFKAHSFIYPFNRCLLSFYGHKHIMVNKISHLHERCLGMKTNISETITQMNISLQTTATIWKEKYKLLWEIVEEAGFYWIFKLNINKRKMNRYREWVGLLTGPGNDECQGPVTGIHRGWLLIKKIQVERGRKEAEKWARAWSPRVL